MYTLTGLPETLCLFLQCQHFCEEPFREKLFTLFLYTSKSFPKGQKLLPPDVSKRRRERSSMWAAVSNLALTNLSDEFPHVPSRPLYIFTLSSAFLRRVYGRTALTSVITSPRVDCFCLWFSFRPTQYALFFPSLFRFFVFGVPIYNHN